MTTGTCYAGNLLRVDLSTGQITAEPLKMDWARDFIGGKGLAFRYLLSELGPGVEPLSPENVVLIFAGALAGTPVATTARTVLCTRSPLTGTILDSYVGGGFAANLRYAGWDGIIITGQSPRPVYLFINDDQVELRDAAPLWGLPIWDAENWLEEHHAPGRLTTLTIGPAGENLVPFACITSEAYRQAGRGGMGAVFGSKHLKAIAVRGTGAVRVPDMAAFMQTYRTILSEHVLSDANLWAWDTGTQAISDGTNAKGILPTRGFTQGEFDGHPGISLETMRAARVRNRACTACPLACGKVTQSVRGERMEGPEYETIALCGSNCGIGELADLIAFNRYCDNLGLDSISAGNVVGLAMTMTEEGIHDFGLHYGDGPAYLQIVQDIAYRRGIGDDLAHGARWLAQKYGGEHVVLEIKGLEFPGYDPRGGFGMGLAYATSERGACHLRSFVIAVETLFDTMHPDSFEGKPALVINDQNLNSVKWSGIFCDFWAINAEDIATLYTLGTGQPYTPEEVMRIGERIWNLGRLFNIREGFRRADDYLPPAIFDRPLRNGAAAGITPTREQYQAALDEYYAIRGWDHDGIPTPERLHELGLDEFIPWLPR